MATNIYVLAYTALPSPWTRVTSYDGRYVRTTASTGSHGSTGGASQHRHAVPAGTSGNASRSTSANGIYTPTMRYDHTHSTVATNTSSSNNDPVYQTYSLWRMDLATWETTYRNFPAGAIVLSTTSITCTGMNRYSTGDGYLIKLGNPGSSGGRSTHTDHTATITLSSTTPGSLTTCDGSNGSVNNSHGHTATMSSVDSNTILPARVQTRLYQVTAETDRAPQNVVCFFDGSPGSNWTTCGWADTFIEGANSNPSNIGTDNHGHTAPGITSSTYSYISLGGSTPAYYYIATRYHTHLVSPTISSTDHIPEYVSLCPYYLNTTLYHVNTYTTTYAMDEILRITKTSSVQFDIRSQQESTAIMTPDVLIQDTIETAWDMDVVPSLKDLEETWDMDAISMIQPWNAYLMAVRILYSHASYDSSVRVIRQVAVNPPVIDTIMKTLAAELNYIRQQVTAMEWANKLPSATGQELDDKWGRIFELPRWLNEDDGAYRKRLQTFTMVHTSCGTKANAEAVLDSIVEDEGATTVETVWPASVRVNWSTDEALRKAKEYQSLIEYTLGHLIASGISWSIYLPFTDYSMDSTFRGPDYLEYDMDLLAKKANMEFNYWLRPRFIVKHDLGWDMDLLASVVDKEISWSERVRISKLLETTVEMDTLAMTALSSPWDMDLISLRSFSRSISADARVANYNLELAWDLDALLKRSKIRTLQMVMTQVLQQVVQADVDMWVKKFRIDEFYDLDLNIWVCEPEEYGMTIGMVPA